ncbi:MAG: hypothetical protein ACRC5C_09010, partial [Bacilli bacterium]
NMQNTAATTTSTQAAVGKKRSLLSFGKKQDEVSTQPVAQPTIAAESFSLAQYAEWSVAPIVNWAALRTSDDANDPELFLKACIASYCVGAGLPLNEALQQTLEFFEKK